MSACLDSVNPKNVIGVLVAGRWLEVERGTFEVLMQGMPDALMTVTFVQVVEGGEDRISMQVSAVQAVRSVKSRWSE